MSRTPVPLPSAAAPTDVPAWLSTDAEEWARLRPAAWARPVWPVLALIVTVAWASVIDPQPPCSAAAPCGPDWGGMMQMGLAIGLLYWLVELPELTLVAAPVLAVIVAWVELPGVGGTRLAANVAVIVALALGVASAGERLAACGRQRELGERAAGIRQPLPHPVGPLARGMIPVGAGLILCALAAVPVVMGLRGIRADEDHAAHATPTTARVIHRGEDSIRLRTADARHLTVGALYPEDYGIGSTVTVLQDGSWRRLAAEPYDAFGWQLLTLAMVLPGISLLATGSLTRSRTASLRRGPVPALRVLQRTGIDGTTWVYAADDVTGRTPLMKCHVLPTLREAPLPEPYLPNTMAYGDEGFPVVDQHMRDMREAVMYGAPYDAAELVLVTTGDCAHPLTLRTCTPARRPRPGEGRTLLAEAESAGARPRSRLRRQQHHLDVDRTAATLKATGEPMRWGAGPVSRTVGAVFMVSLLAAQIWTLMRSLMTDGPGLNLIAVLGLFPVTHMAATLLNWRVTADSTGLWLNGAWRLRHVPWDRVRAIEYKADDTIEIRLPGGETWGLLNMGWPAAERCLGIRPQYVRMAEELIALHLHPDLRPTIPSHPQDRGRPAGPLLLLGAILITVSKIIS
ncbi:hypothetical protein [Streptomyces sp. YIM S03343]